MALSTLNYLILFSIALYSISTLQTANSQLVGNKPTPLVVLTDTIFNDYVRPTENGSWFIMLCVASNSECQSAGKDLEEFSKLQYGKFNIALIDCDSNPKLKNRFSDGSYPKFIYLRGRLIYEYNGPRNIESWTDFLNNGYKTATGKEISIVSSIKETFEYEHQLLFDGLRSALNAKRIIYGGIMLAVVIALSLFFEKSLMSKLEKQKGNIIRDSKSIGLPDKND